MKSGKHPLIELPTIEVNFSCYGFFHVGRDFETVAKASELEFLAFSLVPYFLFCQAIELGFKAFLSLNGAKKPELKRTGHNLMALLDSAERAGLGTNVSFTSEEKRELRKANEYYLGTSNDSSSSST